MDQYAEVLFSLNKHCCSLLVIWLKESLQPQGFPSSRVTAAQKNHFSQQILRYVTVFFLLTRLSRNTLHNMHFFVPSLSPHVMQRAGAEEEGEGPRQRVHTLVQRAPRDGVCCWLLKFDQLLNWPNLCPQCKPAGHHNNTVLANNPVSNTTTWWL